MEAGELATRKELVNQAVSLLFWGMEKSIQGKEIGIRDPQSGDFTALTTPVFDNAKTQAQWQARQEERLQTTPAPNLKRTLQEA